MALWGKVDNEAGKPKYLSDTLRNEQTVSDKDATAGVDVAEAAAADNRAKGIKTPGWTEYRTYTDAQGNTRHKAEVLVAFAGDFTSGDNDTLAPEITITVAPVDVSVVEPATATFSVTATRTGTGTLTYQWQKAESTNLATYTNIPGATSASYTTGATAVADDNGDKYRVVVSLVGAQSVASDAVTLTVEAFLTITEQPQDTTVDALTDANFAVDYVGTGGPAATIQWQSSTDGTTWTDIVGETAFDLTVATTSPLFVTGNQFRAVVTSGAVTLTSDAATLTITA
jgi:hypothetical protein